MNDHIPVNPGDWMTLRYECNETGWTIRVDNASPALEGLYNGPVWLFHGDACTFTAWGPTIDHAWTTRVDRAERETERLRPLLVAAENELEQARDEITQLKEKLVEMAMQR